MPKIILAILLLTFTASSSFAGEVFDRVIKSGKLRCSYGVYDPSIIKDPNTGELSGIFYELTNELGKRLGLKIEWSEEVGYGVIAEGFRTKRYDAFCATVYPTPDRVKSAMFSIPLYYNIVGVFVRADDTRFDKDYSLLDNVEHTLAVKDGDITHAIAKARFPLAKQISIPQQALTVQQLMEVASKKADATFNDVYLLHRYNKNNPEKKLKNVAASNPLKYFPNTFMLPPNEPQLKHMFDVTLSEMVAEGVVEEILKKYDKPGAVNIRPSAPFEISQ